MENNRLYDPAVLTWDDIRRAALHCPFLHALCTMVDQGVAKDQAVLRALLALSAARIDAIDAASQFVVKRHGKENPTHD